MLSINQFPYFARGVAKSLCYLTLPSSDFHFVWARAVIGMNLRCRSDEVDRVKVRRPRARPAGAGQSVYGVRRTTSWRQLPRGLASTRRDSHECDIADRDPDCDAFTAVFGTLQFLLSAVLNSHDGLFIAPIYL